MRSLLILAVLNVLSVAGCGNDHDPAPQAQQAEPPEQQEVYWCPMRCIVEGQTAPYEQHGPGECPVCGMDLVPKEE